MTDEQDLTAEQEKLWREISAMNIDKPESWLCFVNAGHSMDTAKALFDRGLIECQRQMGMPMCRVRQPFPTENDMRHFIPASDDKVKAYLLELSELGRRHKLALSGSATLFEMEPEDMATEYVADAESVVTFGQQ